MEYNVNPNDPNVSTTLDDLKKEWTFDEVFERPFTVEQLFKTLQVIDGFKMLYPNDETVSYFEWIVRNEICMMFGGSILDKE